MTRAAAQPATPSADRRRRRFAAGVADVPFVALTLLALNTWLEVNPQAWQLERVVFGEPWRAVTAHLVHWDDGHRFWDMSVLVLFAALLERLDRVALLKTLGLAVTACTVTFWFGYPELATYRGASGLATALVALFGTLLARGPTRPMGVLLLVGLTVKLALEIRAGSALFAGGSFVNVPWVHAAGAAAGVAVGLTRRGVAPSAR